VATVVVAKWVDQLDEKQLKATLNAPKKSKKLSETRL
jgi:aerobic C4-dicarboxylate transport protein